MNRIEFYTKLNKAKDEVRKKQLEHSSTQNNYNSWFIKVDDYYGINQPRYFTKEEFEFNRFIGFDSVFFLTKSISSFG